MPHRSRRKDGSRPRGRREPAPGGARELPSRVPSGRHMRWGIATGLALVTAALFLPIVGHRFIPIDDPIYVSKNPLLEHAFSLLGLKQILTGTWAGNWQPLTMLSYALDHALFGRAPAGYLATNLALHAFTTGLLFLALERLTGARWRSAFVAAVFGLHPLHVESVAWVSERKDVLSGVFFAAVLWVYAAPAERKSSRRRALALFGLLGLGLLAKSMLVTVPFVLLLLDFWPLERLPLDRFRPSVRALRARVVEKLPLFGLAAVFSAVTYATQSASGAVASLQAVPLSVRLLNVPQAYLAYVERAFWPSGLAVFYPIARSSLTLERSLLAAAPLLAATAGVFALRRRAPYLLVGWFWFVGMLVPVIGLVQVGAQSMADRYTYLPLIGLAICVAWGAVDLAGSRRAARGALSALAAAALVALSVVSTAQIRTWRNGETVTRHALAVTKNNARAHSYLANALLHDGRTAQAWREIEAAIAIQPEEASTQAILAELLESKGQLEKAAAAYREAVQLSPRFAPLYARLGKVLVELGRPGEAEAILRRALARGLDASEIHAALGEALRSEGRMPEAVAQYRAALRLRPGWEAVSNNLAWILATSSDASLRNPQEAVALAEAAARETKREDPNVLDTLAAAYAAAGRRDQALETAREGLRLARAARDAKLTASFEARVRRYEGASSTPAP